MFSAPTGPVPGSRDGGEPAPGFQGALSTALMELRASMFREPVTVVEEPELAGLGAALLALESASGRPVDFNLADRMQVVDPVARWSEAYAGL